MTQHRNTRRRPLRAVPAVLATAVLAFAAGAALTPMAPARANAAINYAVLGDSITHGNYGVDPTGQAWRARFDADIEAATGVVPTSTVLAIGGWGVNDVLPQLASALLDAEKRQHIDLVIVALGTNDAASVENEQRYAKMISTILDGTPQTTRVALTFIGYSKPPASAALINGEHDINNMMFRCGAQRGWTAANVVDPRFAGWIDWQSVPAAGLSADGIHPNGAGYSLMGDLAFSGVQPRMGWQASASPRPTAT